MKRHERLRLLVATVAERVVARCEALRQRASATGRPDHERSGLGLGRERREVVTLAWPIAVALLGDGAMGLVDTKLVGALGPSALGGVAVATTLMYLNYSVVFGLMRGVKVRAAHALGEGNPAHALRYAQAGIALGALCGVVVWLVARDITWALQLLGIDSALVGPAREFLAARTSLAPATCMLSAMVQWRQGVGDSRTPMRITLVGNLLNATLAWSLIHGHLGLPRLGVAGAGYATAFTELVSVSALGAIFAREYRARRSELAREGTPTLREAAVGVCGVGLPTGLQFGVEVIAFTAFTAVLGGLGASEVAAHQVAIATIRASFLPGIAVSEACSVLVGKAFGAGRYADADRVTRAALSVAVAFMASCGVVFAVAGAPIARGFTDDPELVAKVAVLLRVAAVFQVLDAVNIVLRGALRGAKDVRVPALLAIASVWLCVPTSAWFLARGMGMGALGGWIGFIGETSLGAAFLWWRWSTGAWRATTPRAAEESVKTNATVALAGG